MFIGHFGVGFAAKKAAPSVSLGVWFAACQLADLLWPTLVLLGFEQVRIAPGITAVTPLDFVSYPFSHSLVTLCVWGAAFGLIYAGITRHQPIARTAALIAAVTVSHWVLDVATHRPDMPIAPGSSVRLGLGLWNSWAGTIVVESVIFVGGLAMYLRATSGRRRRTIALWSLVAFLVVIHVASLLGPPPPSATAVAWSAEALWLLVVWAWWADRPRSADGHTGSTRNADR